MKYKKEWIYDIVSLLVIIALLFQLKEYTNQCKNYVKTWYEQQERIEKTVRNLSFNFSFNSSAYVCRLNESFSIDDYYFRNLNIPLKKMLSNSN